MANTASSVWLFPLEKITESQLQQLGQVLWSWQPCQDCHNDKQCETLDCPSQRLKRLGRFLGQYKDLTASYDPNVSADEQPVLSSHEDLFEIIKTLKSEPDLPRVQLTDKLFADRSGQRPPADRLDSAVNLAIRVMVMVNCSAQRQSTGLSEYGAYSILWRSDVTFSQFISSIFPLADHPDLNNDDPESSIAMKTALRARKLIKRAGLTIQPTNDLRSHLKLNRKNSVVEIYHHTAFLKEHLRLTKDDAENTSISNSLKLWVNRFRRIVRWSLGGFLLSVLEPQLTSIFHTSGALPRQLALECLDSLQKILFPLSDPKSRSLLLSLIANSSFDPDCLRFESASIRNPDERDISYHYLGARLAELYKELENPNPRGWAERWLERKSGARYVMMATLIGVAIAVMLGMASLAVGGYQAWVGYQAWQHPVRN